MPDPKTCSTGNKHTGDEILRQPIGQDMCKLILAQAGGTQGHHTDPVTVGQLIQGVGMRAGE
jgi:hypothetical protein